MTAGTQTKAPPLPVSERDWHRRVWRIAAPLILSNLSTPIIGVVDTAVVGRMPGAHYLGAVAVGALIFSLLFWGFGFLRMGTTALTAQAVGGGRDTEVRAILGRAGVVAAGLALLLILFQIPLAWATFALLGAGPEVEEQARLYFAVRIWSAPATLGSYVLLGWFLGLRRAGPVFAVQIVVNIVNVSLDLLFVLGFGWGVAGVAAASVIAEFAALAVGLVLAFRIAPDLLKDIRGRGIGRAALFDRASFIRLFAVNRDIFIRTLCLIGGFAGFTDQGARLGDVTLAANAVLLNFYTFMGYALDAFAIAAETLVGGAIGARDRVAAWTATRVSTLWAFAFAVVFAVVWWFTGPMIIDRLTIVPEVRETARAFLPYAALSPVIAVFSFQLDGIFIGATRTAAMRNAMIASLIVYIAALAILVPAYGNHGLWIAFLILMVARTVTLAIAFPALLRSVDR